MESVYVCRDNVRVVFESVGWGLVLSAVMPILLIN